MARCPSCGETLDIKAERCAACGWDRTERGVMKAKKGLSKSLVIGLAVFLGICLIAVAAATIARKPKKPAAVAVPPGHRQTGSDSVPSAAGAPGRNKPQEPAKVSSSRGKMLADDFIKKVDDLLEKANRDRRRLVESRRMTDKANSLLSEIEGKLRSLRSQAGTLENAPNEQSLRAVQKVLDDKLAETRKMFLDLP